jgi:hypothetical protein
MQVTAELTVMFRKNMQKLSYENKIHKKVYQSHLYLAIPRGVKGFLWFIEWKNAYYCFFIDMITQSFQQKNVSFSHDIATAEGTLIYGTLITITNKEYFTMEDIFYSHSQNITSQNWEFKFREIKSILETKIDYTFYGFPFLKLCLPFLEYTIDEFLHKLKECPYPIAMVQYRLWNKSNFYLYTPYIDFLQIYHNKTTTSAANKTTIPFHKKEQYKEFLVKASVVNDIYYLYDIGNKLGEGEGIIAHIPDYTTSVMLNKLFRNIKENERLDSLEESDDENEFENENENKFVDINKTYKMLCKFNTKFKKWFPIKVL